MIHHASIGTSDPQSTAVTLAHLFEGKLLRLPNQFQTFSIRMRDGSMLEVWPSDKVFEADPSLHHVSVRPRQEKDHGSQFHLFISTPKSPSEALRLAREAGWPAYVRAPQYQAAVKSLDKTPELVPYPVVGSENKGPDSVRPTDAHP